MTPAEAVFFISFGGPEKREEVMPFLEIVTSGRGIPPNRLKEVARHYDVIGGSSPINAITTRQAKALEKVLAEKGTPLPVYIGQRNWHPFLEDQLRRMKSDGIKRAVGFITAAHRCEASLERYILAVEKARNNLGAGAPEINYVDPWFDHPLFIDAIAARIQEKAPKEGWSWVFTAHSIPCAMAEESPYVQDLRRTAELVCEKLSQKKWQLAYSSRSGHPRDPWLEPDVSDAIRQESQKAIHEIFFIPIGFVADHVEVLFDLDVEAQQTAQEVGVHLYRSQTVGDHPLFIQMMAEIIQKRLSADVPPSRVDVPAVP